jgi:hypothetical protein
MKELKTVCKNCSAATLKVYSTNIRRLYKIYHGEPIKTLSDLPKNSKWLMSEKMLKKYKTFPNNIRRNLSSSAFIATRIYGIKSENKWNKLMIEDAKEYESRRSQNKKSEYEQKNIPKNGLKEVKKAFKTYKTQIKNIFSQEPSLKNLYKYQLYIALKLMSTNTPFRNDLPTINVESHKKGNYLTKNKGGYKIVMTTFKNSDKLGTKEVILNRANSMEMKKFLKYRHDVVDHHFLFSLKSGKPMTKSAFSQALIKLTSNLLNKKIGSRLIRVMFATDNRDILSKADAVSNKLLHSKSGRQTRQYVRK